MAKINADSNKKCSSSSNEDEGDSVEEGGHCS
jgi:hypothetical protein